MTEVSLMEAERASDALTQLLEVAAKPAGRVKRFGNLLETVRFQWIAERNSEADVTVWLYEKLVDVVPKDLARDDRVALSEVLIRAGLSIRMISSIVGISHGQVHRDKGTTTPASGVVTGLDSKSYPRIRESRPWDPHPNKRRPSGPLTNSFLRTVTDALRAMRALERWTRDERFSEHARFLKAAHADELLEVRRLLEEALTRMGIEDTETHTSEKSEEA